MPRRTRLSTREDVVGRHLVGLTLKEEARFYESYAEALARYLLLSDIWTDPSAATLPVVAKAMDLSWNPGKIGLTGDIAGTPAAVLIFQLAAEVVIPPCWEWELVHSGPGITVLVKWHKSSECPFLVKIEPGFKEESMTALAAAIITASGDKIAQQMVIPPTLVSLGTLDELMKEVPGG